MLGGHGIAGFVVAISTAGAAAYNAKKLGEAVQMLAGPYRWMRGFVRLPGALAALAETQAGQGAALEKIVKELTPNGGLSLRDAVVRIEQNGIEDRQRNRALLLDVATGIFEADGEGKFAWVNRTLCRMMERVPDEILGSGWESCLAAEDREMVMGEWNRCIQAGRECVMNLRMVKADGTRTPVINWHTYVLRGEAGEVIGFQGICRRVE